MLRKLVRFELKKQLSGPFILIALCLLLVVTVLLNCGIREYNEDKKMTEEAGMEYQWTFWESRGGFIKSMMESKKSTREQYALLEADGDNFAVAMAEKYGEDILTSQSMMAMPEEIYDTPGYFGDRWSDGSMLHPYQNVQTWNADLQATLEKTLAAAKDYGRESLEEGDNYGVRRNIDIIQLYNVPRGKITSQVAGWDDLLFDSQAMLFAFLMILLTCGGTFSTERERQTVLLLHTAKNGKGKTMAAKYLSSAIIATGLTLLFQGVALAAIWFKEGGLLGLNQPAAAMEQLTLISWPVTVGQYVLIHLACQIFAAVVLSVVINTISALSKNSVLSYVVGVLVLGLFLIAQGANVKWLAGPLSLVNTVNYFDSYCTANLLGFPVLWIIVQSVLWLIVSGLCVHSANRIFHRKGTVV